ncbi:UNVERIFIED_CONTAM: hypothetical protein Scaly_3032700 [Sesamum calycinum]|uniref:GAG-pre-integrase domain-containing protein n=1 Tax=Sesamum calycinum TaxID=2727403 RepID=A0AAW2K7A9_9LAMI
MVYAVEEQRAVKIDLEANSSHLANQLALNEERKPGNKFVQKKLFIDKKNLVCTNCHKKGHARDTCFRLHGVPDWYKSLGDRNKKGKAFTAAVDVHNEELTKNSSQNVAEILVKVMKMMQKTTMPSDPLTNHANYAQFDGECAVNLLSVSQLCDQSRYQILFTQHRCLLQDQETRDNLVMGVLFRRLYTYSNHSTLPIISSNIPFQMYLAPHLQYNSDVWHNRLGHASAEAVKHIQYFDCKDGVSDKPCDTCHRAKQSRLSFPVSLSHSDENFDLVHIDPWGPYTANSISGCIYVNIDITPHKAKFHSRALKCVLIGYAMHQKAYKLFDLDHQSVIYSRDVEFYETQFFILRHRA